MDLKGFLKDEIPVDARGGFSGITAGTPKKPLIAAVDGYALAGAWNSRSRAISIVASRNIKFGTPR